MEKETKNANLLKTVVLQALVDEGYLSLEKARDFNSNYAVIIAEPSWFVSVYEALFPARKSGVFYNIVKFIGKDRNVNNIDEDEDDLAELKFQLSKAESEENYELAKKLRDKIKKLKNEN